MSPKLIMNKFNISSSTVYDITKAKDKLREFAYTRREVPARSGSSVTERKWTPDAKFAQLDAVVCKWHKHQRFVGNAVPGYKPQPA